MSKTPLKDLVLAVVAGFAGSCLGYACWQRWPWINPGGLALIVPGVAAAGAVAFWTERRRSAQAKGDRA